MAQTQPFASGNIRQLFAADEPAISQLLHGDRGFGLFIRSNLLSYGFGYNVSYWGQFHGVTSSEQPHLASLLMIANGSADVFTLPGVDVVPLAQLALRQPLRFIMGDEQTMLPIEPLTATMTTRHETHRFAELPAHRFRKQLPGHGSTVRRAEKQDVESLTALYQSASGFEGMPKQRLRKVMHNRVAHLRTYIAEDSDGIAAAASTSAEDETGAMLGGVWTHPLRRNRGHCQAVVSALCANLLSEQKRPHLFFLRDNSAAEHIYTKLGFRIIGGWKVINFE